MILLNIYIMNSLFYSRTLLFNLPPPRTGGQCDQHFGNDKKYICSPRVDADCRVPTGHYNFSAIFYLVIVFTAGQYKLI